MTDSVGVSPLGAGQIIGSTNNGLFPLPHTHSVPRTDRERREAEDSILDQIEDMSATISRYEDKVTADGHTLRDRGLDDINWGLTVFANGLRLVSAVLTVLGGDSTDRNDNYDEAVGTMFSLAGSVLKYFSKYLLSTNQTPAVDKLGIAANTENLSPAEKLQKIKAHEYVSSLSGEEVKKLQAQVLEHVQNEANKNSLTEAQAQLLLAQTLDHNGLPQLVQAGQTGDLSIPNPLNSIGSIFSGATNALGSVFSGGEDVDVSDSDQQYPGLPKPGTLDYTVKMALFKATQALNGYLRGSQPAAADKIGEAAETAESDGGGILTAVALLPQSVKAAASQVAQFLSPTNEKTDQNPGSGTFSQISTGINPAFAALGVLTTGALGTVLYSYAANSRSDLATSATSFAQGAFDAIQRNAVVERAGEVLNSITGNKFEELTNFGNQNYQYPDYGNIGVPIQYSDYGGQGGYSGYGDQDGYSDYGDQGGYSDYGGYPNYGGVAQSGGYSDYGYGYPTENIGNGGTGYADPRVENYENVLEYPDPDYQDPREQQLHTSADHGYQTNFNSSPDEPTSGRIPSGLPNGIPDNIEFYEPETTDPEVPFVTYTEKHNPWYYLESGEPTDHLYRAFS